MDTVIVASSQFYSHYPKRIPQGTVNAETVLVRLDSEWDGLTVIVHWLNVETGVEITPMLERDKPNTIPWEVLTDLGELRMGLVGLDGETVIKPTIWLTYGYVVDGVDPESGSDPQPPTPSWEKQMVEQATQANQAAQAAQKAAEEAAESVASAGPYAEEAKEAAEAAKASQNAAAISAQQASQAAKDAQAAAGSIGNAVEQAQSAATAAGSAQRAAETAQTAAAQSAGTAQGSATTAIQAAQTAQRAATQAGQYLASVEADAQAAATAATAAGESREAAQVAAQTAANARDQANTAATAADTAKGAAEQAATTAGNAQAGAAQSAQAAASSAAAAQEAQQAAEAAAAVFPPLTEDVANKFLVADSEGKKLIFIAQPSGGGDSYEWRLIRTVTAPEDPTTDQSGVTWKVSDEGNIFGFSFDTDQNGLPFEAEEVIFTFNSGFGPGSGDSRLNVEYNTGKVIGFYRSWPSGARRGVFYQNKLTDATSLPVMIFQTQYVTGATVDAPWSNPTPPITTPDIWRYFGISSGSSDYYMKSFTFKIFGRFKK